MSKPLEALSLTQLAFSICDKEPEDCVTDDETASNVDWLIDDTLTMVIWALPRCSMEHSHGE